jgi:hypothetical protein
VNSIPDVSEIIRLFSSPAAKRVPRAPYGEERAAVVIQRRFRGLLARRRLKENKGRNAAMGLAMLLAAGVGSMVGRLVDDILLAPVNLASEQLFHRAIGKVLSVLVKRYDKRNIKITGAGISIGGKDGLHLDDEALAAMLGGYSQYTDVWISSIRIKLPVTLHKWPVQVHVQRLEFTMPSVPIALSAKRKQELELALGQKPAAPAAPERRPPAYMPSPSFTGSAFGGSDDGGESHVSDRRSTVGVTAAPRQSRAGTSGRSSPSRSPRRAFSRRAFGADSAEEESKYGQLERAIDGAVLTFETVEILLPPYVPEEGSDEATVPVLLLDGDDSWEARAHMRACGPFVCGVRRRKPGPSRLRAWLGSKLEMLGLRREQSDSTAAEGPPLPQGSTIVLLEGVRLTNATQDFVETNRIAIRETRRFDSRDPSLAAIDGALGGALSATYDWWTRVGKTISQAFGGNGGRAAGSADGADNAAQQQPLPLNVSSRSAASAASGGIQRELHVYKRLVADSLSATMIDAQGHRSPYIRSFPMAIHGHLVRSKRTAKLVQLDLDVVLPDLPIGYLIAGATAPEALSPELRGMVRWRTDSSPITAIAPTASGAVVVQHYLYEPATKQAAEGVNALVRFGQRTMDGIKSLRRPAGKERDGRGARRLARKRAKQEAVGGPHRKGPRARSLSPKLRNRSKLDRPLAGDRSERAT